jgi:PTH1 family peptidyl-tRNA hydrolase
VGFEVVDELARRRGVTFESSPAEAIVARVREGEGTLFVKPLAFMNLSGHAVGEIARYFRIAPPDMLIVIDEAQLPLGRLRARARGSAGGHNGLKSIIEALGSEEFPRLRIGVGRGDDRRDLADHVLAQFDPDEREVIAEAIAKAADAAELFASHGIDIVMNRYNRKEDTATDDTEKEGPQRDTDKEGPQRDTDGHG